MHPHPPGPIHFPPDDWIMKQPRDLNWLMIPWAGFLFGLGGYWWKPWRRWILPMSGAYLAMLYGVPIWRCLAYLFSTLAVFSIGYSPDRYGLLMVAVCGALYGLTPIWLFKWDGLWRSPMLTTVSVTCVLFTGMTWASLHLGWPWKIVEIAIGMVHGLWVALAVEEWKGV